MASNAKKPHAIFIPYPAQGHITPMFKLAKLLHSKAFHVTFVNTEHNHTRLLKSKGQTHLDGLPGFQFESIPDGLPPPETADATQDIPTLCDSTAKSCPAPFVELIHRLNKSSRGPPVTCIVADGSMSFAVEAGREFGVPVVLFWTPSACGFLSYNYYHVLVEKGLTPLKDASYLTNGYLDTTIDWIPGMKTIPLRYLPSFIRTTNPDDIMLNYVQKQVEKASKASAVLLNTFDVLEHDVVDALRGMYPSLYTVGPLNLFVEEIYGGEDTSTQFWSSLWKEEEDCIEWLDLKEPNSVVYVNFGSITTITNDQLQEFAWGLARSNKPFLWVIRPDLVAGETAVLAPEFVSETEDRGKVAGWCPQEQVLKHPSVGGFLSHMGWNSTLESVCGGVPMVCWPFFAEQQTNCWFACEEWGIGMEIGGEVRRGEVEELVRKLMEGESSGEMRKSAMEWRRVAEEATSPGGSSYRNFEKVVSILLGDKQKV